MTTPRSGRCFIRLSAIGSQSNHAIVAHMSGGFDSSAIVMVGR